jgi:hypothetical protein
MSMDLTGGILTGIGALGNMFGIGKKGYGQANYYFDQYRNYLDKMSKVGNQYGDLAQQQMGYYNEDNPLARSAQRDYMRALSINPYDTSQGQASLANQYAGDIWGQTQAANAATTADLSRRGFGGMSSMLTGATANNYMRAYQSIAAAKNAAREKAHDYDLYSKGAIAQGYGGMASQDLGLGNQFLGEQGDMYGRVGQGYGNIGQQYAAQTDAYNRDVSGAWSGIQSLGGNIWGKGIDLDIWKYKKQNPNG